MEPYQLKDKVVVDLGDTVMGNLPYRFFPGTVGFEYRAMMTTQGACVLLGITEDKEIFFNSFTQFMRDVSNPHHRLLCHVLSGNEWFPVGFGKSFSIANDELVKKMLALSITDNNYPAVIKYIEENFFERDQNFGVVCDPFTVKLLQQDNYQLAYELIKDLK